MLTVWGMKSTHGDVGTTHRLKGLPWQRKRLFSPILPGADGEGALPKHARVNSLTSCKSLWSRTGLTTLKLVLYVKNIVCIPKSYLRADFLFVDLSNYYIRFVSLTVFIVEGLFIEI